MVRRRRSPINRAELAHLKQSVSLARIIERHVGTLEKHGKEYLTICAFHAEDTPSFRIYPDGHYFCFGCGAHGDAIDWLQIVDRMSFEGAVRHLHELGGVPDPEGGIIEAHFAESEWLPIVPVPVGVPELVLRNGWTTRIYNPKRAGDPKEWTMFRPQLVHRYRDTNGALLGSVLRCSFASGKKFTPCITWCRHNTSGETRWCIVPLPRPRSVYGLNRLAERPAGTVLLTEGEKTCDAAQRLLPQFVSATWQGGARGYAHSDWRPLAGRSVVCIPDADDEGRAAFHGRTNKRGMPIEGIIEIITSIGANVRYVSPPASLPDGWDLADAEEAGWDGPRTLAWIKAHLVEARDAA